MPCVIVKIRSGGILATVFLYRTKSSSGIVYEDFGKFLLNDTPFLPGHSSDIPSIDKNDNNPNIV